MSSPAGWYPQPDGQQRYWDGELWTDHFAPGEQPSATALQMMNKGHVTGSIRRRFGKANSFGWGGLALVVLIGALTSGFSGVAFMLGYFALVVGVIALARGRVDWARLGSRAAGGVVLAVAVVAIAVGSATAPPSTSSDSITTVSDVQTNADAAADAAKAATAAAEAAAAEVAAAEAAAAKAAAAEVAAAEAAAAKAAAAKAAAAEVAAAEAATAKAAAAEVAAAEAAAEAATAEAAAAEFAAAEAAAAKAAASPPEPAAQDVYYANCTAVRAAGAAPIYAGDLGFQSKFDRDKDGVGCE